MTESAQSGMENLYDADRDGIRSPLPGKNVGSISRGSASIVTWGYAFGQNFRRPLPERKVGYLRVSYDQP